MARRQKRSIGSCLIGVVGLFALVLVLSCASSTKKNPYFTTPVPGAAGDNPATVMATSASTPRTPTPAAELGKVGEAWVNVTGNLADLPSECGNLTMLSSQPSSGLAVAGVARRGLWLLGATGTWTQLSGSTLIPNRPSSIQYDPDNPNTFWESGIYAGAGVYKTTNGGSSFQQLGSVTYIDYLSIDFSDRTRATLLGGAHEQSRVLWRSVDQGQTWTNIGLNLPPGTGFSSHPILINSRTYLVNSDARGEEPGIFRTTDGGSTWTKVSPHGPASAPLVTSTGAIFWVASGSLIRSTDAGATWTEVSGGLADVGPVELGGGVLVAATISNLIISTDGGSKWSLLGPITPFTPQSLAYSSARKAFLVSQSDCGDRVLPDAVMQLDWSPS